jgi:hypothetical protein
VAPTGTTAVIDVAELMVTVTADVALNETVAPQRFVPLIVTPVPTGPLAGENDVIVGAAGAVTSKFAVLSSFPSLFWTLMGPSTAAHGTTAVSWLSLATLTLEACAPVFPLNRTIGVPKFRNPELPVETVTAVPGGPDVGRKVPVTGAAAHAGNAVTSTPTTPSTSASAVARVDAFLFGNLIGLLLSGVAGDAAGRHVPVPTTAASR